MNTTLAVVGASAAMALAVGIGGCSERSSAQSGGLMTLTGSKYCTPFKTANTNVNATLNDPAAAFDDCLHRWAYTLAPARDPADVVARASVDACGPILTTWNQQTLGQNPQPPPQRFQGRGPQQQQQQNNPLAQRMGMVESRALFYVVQARAAGCAPPPANSLVTTTNLAGDGASS